MSYDTWPLGTDKRRYLKTLFSYFLIIFFSCIKKYSFHLPWYPTSILLDIDFQFKHLKAISAYNCSQHVYAAMNGSFTSFFMFPFRSNNVYCWQIFKLHYNKSIIASRRGRKKTNQNTSSNSWSFYRPTYSQHRILRPNTHIFHPDLVIFFLNRKSNCWWCRWGCSHSRLWSLRGYFKSVLLCISITISTTLSPGFFLVLPFFSMPLTVYDFYFSFFQLILKIKIWKKIFYFPSTWL